MPSPIYSLASDYVDRMATLDPIAATAQGIAGHDADLTDYSPAGVEARAAHQRETIAALAALTPTDDRERIAAAFITERLSAFLAADAAGEPYRALRIIGSPMGGIRQCFDLMPHATVEDWVTIATRMEKIPAALGGFRASLEHGRSRGLMAARRQAVECAKQAEAWSGFAGGQPFFARLAESRTTAGIQDATLGTRLEAAAAAATEAYAAFGRYLRDEYAPAAPEKDAVGPDRYRTAALATLGATIDLDETYNWAWDDLHRIEADMQATAALIRPGLSVAEVEAFLEADPARAIEGEDAFRHWMQDLQDRTIAELNGKHFDIPEPVRSIEAMIAPPGGAAAMYYT
ncbi:MAG: DUF885 domain-containing protein, partial [Tepidiformaceae bacterium]